MKIFSVPGWNVVLCFLLILLTNSCEKSRNGAFQQDEPKVEANLPPSPFFPVSVWYSGGKARAPMQSKITPRSREEWSADLKKIRELGFNTVRTWVEWTHTEPQRGEYNLENLKLLCELAQDADLKVFIQMYGESAPDWVGESYPASLLEAHSGDKVKPQSAPGYCVDHPGVREAITDFFTETARIASSFTNLYGWDLWSEPHIIQWGAPRWIPGAQYCYCPYTQNRFRKWLMDKYGSLEKLNEAWYRTFESWDEVEPPRFNTILSYTDFIDWKNFIYHKMAEDLRMRYEAIRKVDKNGVITSHASPASIFSSPHGSGAEDDFLFAEQVDHYGISQYPKHNRPGDWNRWVFMTNADFSYSANKKNGGYYVGEFQAGFGTVGLRIGDEVTPEDHRIWFWSSLATGARAVNIYAYYPMNAGYESGGYGLIQLDGTITERARSLGRIAAFVSKNQDLFVHSKPVDAEVALVYNPLAQMIGGEGEAGGRGARHINALIGYYRAFMNYNVPVEFIHRKEVESGDLSRYKLIIAPFPVMFTQQAANGLKSYVEKGGFLVSEARMAWNDDRGYATEVIPGMGLSEVFGIREHKVEVKDSVSITLLDINHKALSRLNTGEKLKGVYFAESLIPVPDSKAKLLAVLEDSTHCLSAASYGQGEALFIGSFLDNHPEFHNSNLRFILGLLDWAGVEKPFTSSFDGKSEESIVLRLHKNPDGMLMYILNQGQKPQEVDIQLNAIDQDSFRLHEIIKDVIIKSRARDGRISWKTGVIPPSDVEIWSITPDL